MNNVEYLLNKLKNQIGQHKGEQPFLYQYVFESVSLMIRNNKMYTPLRNSLVNKLSGYQEYPGERRAIEESLDLLRAFER